MGETGTVDRDLIAAWLCGRSIARGLPRPVPDRDGWRVDTRSPTELRRYVFAAVEPGFLELATEIAQPGIALRLCADGATMRRLLPDRWSIEAPSFVMIGPANPATGLVPSGYTAKVTFRSGAIECIVRDAEGRLAASGYAAETDGVFVYDRIVVTPAYWRRGLGRAMMALLGNERRSATSRQVLVATDMGRSLYASLGWTEIAPYASALIPHLPA